MKTIIINYLLAHLPFIIASVLFVLSEALPPNSLIGWLLGQVRRILLNPNIVKEGALEYRSQSGTVGNPEAAQTLGAPRGNSGVVSGSGSGSGISGKGTGGSGSSGASRGTGGDDDRRGDTPSF